MLEGSGEATSDLVDAFNARLRYGNHAQYHPSTLEPALAYGIENLESRRNLSRMADASGLRLQKPPPVRR